MWISTSTQRQIEWLQREITALRDERALLRRDLNLARDRGDQAINALLEAKGERPFLASPSPPPEHDPFEELPDAVTAIRELIRERGMEATLNGD